MKEELIQKIKDTQIPDGTIIDVQLEEEDEFKLIPGLPMGMVPEHIRVNVVCKPEKGSNINIEIWLPTKGWNGSFLGTGNGGAAGMLVHFVMIDPLRMGFAVANTDMGTSAGVDCGIENQAVWKDFGYRATHLMTVAAKKVIEAYYGEPPKHSYFSGGSTGGQQALSEAQRYPEDYDGILATAPAFNRTNLHIGFIWDWLALNDSEDSKFSQEDAALVVQTILEKCGKAGERKGDDPFMYRPDKIQITRDIFDDSGLKKAQIDALMKLYEGVNDPETGECIHIPMLIPGSEACDLGIVSRCDETKFATDFFYIFRWIFGADFDFHKFDFHRDTKRIHEQLDSYLNVTETDLSKFRDRGGKLLMVHGTADPIIPYTSSIKYYEQVCEQMGDVKSFFRLFLAPGMAHLSGGPGVHDLVVGVRATPKDSKHLALLALKEWVEEGREPDSLYPVSFRDNNPVNGYLDDTFAYERRIIPYETEIEGRE